MPNQTVWQPEFFSPFLPISSSQAASPPLPPPTTVASKKSSEVASAATTTKTTPASKFTSTSAAVARLSRKMASPSLPAPFLTRPEFAAMALDSVKESYGDKFDFELDDDNFCILFKNKLNPENIGKMYLQNRYQCMLSYGPDINTEKVSRR